MKMAFETTAVQKIEVYKIAILMDQNPQLHKDFISQAVELALHSQGTFELMSLWRDEKKSIERDEIIADIQESIDDFQSVAKNSIKKPKISFENLDETIRSVKNFKKKLRDLIDQRGGINHLAKLTKIPQPSLSRMFSSASMPRKTTLYKIALALDLDEKDIVTEWSI